MIKIKSAASFLKKSLKFRGKSLRLAAGSNTETGAKLTIFRDCMGWQWGCNQTFIITGK